MSSVFLLPEAATQHCAMMLRFANIVVNELTKADHANYVFCDEATFS